VIRALVLYVEEPDAERYEQHVKLCRKVPGATAFRHGRIFGAPMGKPKYRHYAEWEFPDSNVFKEASGSPEFMATGKDAIEMGGTFEVLFAEID
jgi:uncharacterized protein (TIGR02118 family)